ncbi:hypothetical protein QE152_g15639 [Popillia japonica]|uniref:Uncharacterized protein n=1 Tax=Popillia japonica TaxID=7064 RepID=A0AAW1L928_POPJA
MSSFKVLDEKYTRPSSLSKLLSEILVDEIQSNSKMTVKLENKHYSCKRKIFPCTHTVEHRSLEDSLCEIFKKFRLDSDTQNEQVIKCVAHSKNCKLTNRGCCSMQQNFAGANKSLNVTDANLKLSKIPVRTPLNNSQTKTTPHSKIPVRIPGSEVRTDTKKHVEARRKEMLMATARQRVQKSCLKSPDATHCFYGCVNIPENKRRVTFSEFVEEMDKDLVFPDRVFKKPYRHLKASVKTENSNLPLWRY